MTFGRAGKRNRDSFDAAFAGVQKAIAAHRFEEALARLMRMGEDNLFSAAYRWKYHATAGQLLYMLGELEAALPHLRSSWNLEGAPQDERAELLSNYLMTLHYTADISDAEMREEHGACARIFGGVPQFSHGKRRREKIRIGYVSPSLSEHVVLNFAVQLFSGYDHARFAVYLYDVGRGRGDEVTDWLAGMVDGYRNLGGKPPAEAAAAIYADEIDILFDLAGHTAGGRTLRIAAYRPVSGIGYFDTTGLPAMDYVLGDPVCDPPGMEALFFEKILRLPRTHLCFTPPERFAPYENIVRRAHAPVVFGSFNNFSKITDETLRLWAEILRRVPDARLLLKNVNSNMEPVERMRRRAARAGLSSERIELRPGTRDSGGRDNMRGPLYGAARRHAGGNAPWSAVWHGYSAKCGARRAGCGYAGILCRARGAARPGRRTPRGPARRGAAHDARLSHDGRRAVCTGHGRSIRDDMGALSQ